MTDTASHRCAAAPTAPVIAGAGGPSRPPSPFAAGIDLTDVDRLARAINRSGRRFVDHVFTSEEQRAAGLRGPDSVDPVRAARMFAVKECVVKAAGGMPRTGRYTDIETCTDDTDLVTVDGVLSHHLGSTGGRLIAHAGLLDDTTVLAWACATHEGHS